MNRIVTLSLLLFATLSLSAQAKTTTLTGDQARDLMEALAGAGYPVSNLDQDWSVKDKIQILTGEFTCHYSVGYPDEWMSGVDCQNAGPGFNGSVLKNPLALARSVRPAAFEEAGAGNRWISVKSVACTLSYNAHTYICVVEAQDDII